MKKELLNQFNNICLIGIRKKVENQELINIRGTGILLENGYIASCYHVYKEIADSEKPNIFYGCIAEKKGKISNYKFTNLKFITEDAKTDFALFKPEEPYPTEIHGFNLEQLMKEDEVDNLVMGDDVDFVGYPLANEVLQMGMGITLLASSTVIGTIKYKNEDQKVDFIIIDKAVNPGSSGSPVFKDDKIIGLASGTLNRTHKVAESIIPVSLGLGMVRTSNYLLDLVNTLDK